MINLVDYYSICDWWRNNKKPEMHLGHFSNKNHIKYNSRNGGLLFFCDNQTYPNKEYCYNGNNEYCTADGDIFYIGASDNNNKIVKFLNQLHSIEIGDLEGLNEICLQYSVNRDFSFMLWFWGGILRVKDFYNVNMNGYVRYEMNYEWLWSKPIWGPSDNDIFYGEDKKIMVKYGAHNEIKKECLYSTWKELQAFK